jgi:hypothetical protein
LCLRLYAQALCVLANFSYHLWAREELCSVAHPGGGGGGLASKIQSRSLVIAGSTDATEGGGGGGGSGVNLVLAAMRQVSAGAL